MAETFESAMVADSSSSVKLATGLPWMLCGRGAFMRNLSRPNCCSVSTLTAGSAGPGTKGIGSLVNTGSTGPGANGGSSLVKTGSPGTIGNGVTMFSGTNISLRLPASSSAAPVMSSTVAAWFNRVCARSTRAVWVGLMMLASYDWTSIARRTRASTC